METAVLKTECFASAEAFLDACKHRTGSMPHCRAEDSPNQKGTGRHFLKCGTDCRRSRPKGFELLRP
jgi:hypothetical protein